MYSHESLIGNIYDDLYRKTKYPLFAAEPERKRIFYEDVSQVYEDKGIPQDLCHNLECCCSDMCLANEIKGFMSGIYFALKLKDEFKEDMEKIKKCLNLTDE